MSSGYHEGEIAVQERAGVRNIADRVGNSRRLEIPDAAGQFLEALQFIVAGTADPDGRPWASLLAGEPGFIRLLDGRTFEIDAVPEPADPWSDYAAAGGPVGLLAIDFATRRRARINGHYTLDRTRRVRITVEEIYSNCPKYIRVRTVEPQTGPGLRNTADGLSEDQRALIRAADTFFVATVHPHAGADASHRGGEPGFVRVEGNVVTWPDYRGNAMFNTLGNLAVHPSIGVTFPDFATGRLLQLNGVARIEWDPRKVAEFPQAERLVVLTVETARETGRGLHQVGEGTPDV
ncbi:MAG: pyridoxamine 5'-phosphate oxidase family protein [Gemmatimonadales bacterium]